MIHQLGYNSYGFFNIQSSDKTIDHKASGVHCSQVIRLSSNTQAHYGINLINGTITFYYPSDWLITRARRKPFFDLWLKLTETFFYKVTHIGSIKKLNVNPIPITYTPETSKHVTKGDLVVNDSWEKFEIEVKDNNLEMQNRHYCAYCMIRYLFSDHYDTIVNTFAKLYVFCSYTSFSIDPFYLFQIVHYYYSGYRGYYGTYCLMSVKSVDGKANKLISLKQFDERVKSDKGIHNIFSSNGESDLLISDLQKKIDYDKLKEIYEQIK